MKLHFLGTAAAGKMNGTLILNRKIGEVINIGDTIELHVRQIDNNCAVRIGIAAPKEVSIYRGEIYPGVQM